MKKCVNPTLSRISCDGISLALQKPCQRSQSSDLSLHVLWVNGRYACKISGSNMVMILNPIRSFFAKLRKDAKIFVTLAKFLRFHKKFWFAKVRHYSAEIGCSGYQIDQGICEFGGATKLISTGKKGEFLGKYIDAFTCFPQPMRDICPRSARICGDVWQCPV